MHIKPIRIRAIKPPQDLLLDAIFSSRFAPRDGDIICVSSKVVAIDEGRCEISRDRAYKESHAKQRAEKYVELSYGRDRRALFTLTQGVLIRTAGIDESNGNGYMIFWPQDPHASARRIQKAIEKKYNVKLQGVIITDSYSIPLRRGAIGFALGWSGMNPIKDYRGTPDVFGRKIKITVANVVDALASACVFVMGESGASTPLCVVRGVIVPKLKKINKKNELDRMPVQPEDDIFSPFILSQKWKKGGNMEV